MNGILLALLIYVMVWRPRRCLCDEDEDLPTVASQVQYGVRSQRDLMGNVTIDQVPMVGVNVYDTLFKSGRNNESRALMSVMELMQHGVQSFVIDLEQRSNQLILRKSNVSFDKFLNVLQSYVNSSDNNLSANMMVLLLRISTEMVTKKTNQSSPAGSGYNSSSQSVNMTYLLDQNLGRQRIYTPDDLENDRELGQTYNTNGTSKVGWPTLSSFLYQTKRRVVLAELTETSNKAYMPYVFNGSSIMNFDLNNATLGLPQTINQIKALSEKSWRYLEASFTPADIKVYMDYGYNPIIANEYAADNFASISELLNTTLMWSWEPNEPYSRTTDRNTLKHNLVAYNCAVLHYTALNSSAAWIVDNCYTKHRGLCRNKGNGYLWRTTVSYDTYFEFSESKCPNGFEFSLPKTPLEQLAVSQYLANISSEDTNLWIDMNSVYVNDCWVTGGPHATCPYQRAVSKRNFVKMITPVTVCSFVILIIVCYLNFVRVPIHNNRKSWKRIVNEVSKWEVDGVPS
ncbi:MTC6 (YHR151C) [Zygosaccharomyces parabailii]|nr:MTC6 (YHR151C) [Zygosaccharomyces parabailii]